MRKKPNLERRMEKCANLLVHDPGVRRGAWLVGSGLSELYLDIGCGKGSFACAFAEANPHIMLVAIDRVPEALIMGMERAASHGLHNILFTCIDVKKLDTAFSEGEVSRIFINFCDPWPKRRDAKHRLTSPGYLALYKKLLGGGEIHFKTDDPALFEYSLKQLAEAGFSLTEINCDLHGGGVRGFMTDYEARFHENGLKINYCVARIL